MKLAKEYYSQSFFKSYHTGWCRYAIHYDGTYYWAVCPNTGMTSTPFYELEALETTLHINNNEIDWIE